ncbi:hypothetical protein [Spirosoma sordidisoli]|uniref:Uncharacterized protein n=1 Tax=Spirosoma sordidisoli TaxID=2502893 RepID=A0A4Q2UBL8_9BACT|nr:hypothetical protein [Spirosoma sordidisoli]RYC66337.1 hypothetical protein EQG79_30140 [Spirosoma sordidisoli]
MKKEPNRPVPTVLLTSTITKHLYEEHHRHFFSWQVGAPHKTLLRIQLIDERGYIMPLLDGTDLRTVLIEPGVNSYVHLDADRPAAGFQYWTKGLIRGDSRVVLDAISPQREDLRVHNANVAAILAQERAAKNSGN